MNYGSFSPSARNGLVYNQKQVSYLRRPEVGRKKREKKKKKRRVEEPVSALPEIPAGKAGQPEQPDLDHLSGEWREFYSLVINRLNQT